MTMIEFHLYESLQAMEFHRISKGFQKSPVVQRLTDLFNRVSQFFVSQVLRDEVCFSCPTLVPLLIMVLIFILPLSFSQTYEPLNVSSYISGLISVGHCCKSWNNLDGLMMCIAALNTTAVSRLQDAWAALSRQDSQRFEELTEFTAKNYKKLRACMNSCSSPAIPHFALAVRDLTGLDESPTFLVSNGHVNCHKMRTISQVVWQMMRHRDGTPYQFNEVSRLQDWIQYSKILNEKEAYERSRGYTNARKSSDPRGVLMMKKNNRRSTHEL